jgi:tetratricopeptide (TPR) repeat protein
LKALGRAASSLRAKLGESLSSIAASNTPVDRATTGSLEALRAYSLANELNRNGNWTGAVPMFQHAIELDSSFAMAYAKLATVYSNLRRIAPAREMSAKAFELRDRVSERERLYIVSRYYASHDQSDKEMETLELWVQTYPRDYEPRNNLGVDYNVRGQYEKGLIQLQEAAKLNPGSVLSRQNLAFSFLSLGRLKEAKELCQNLPSAGPDTLCTNYLFQIAFLENDATAMNRFAETAKTMPNFIVLANAAASRGKRKQAREFFLRASDVAPPGAPGGTDGAALMEVLFGNPTEAGQLVRDRPGLQAALVLALSGSTKRAEDMANAADSQRSGTDLIALNIVRAAIELQRDNPAKALDALRPIEKYEPSPPTTSSIYIRGLAQLQAKSGAAAVGEFQKIIDRPAIVPVAIVHPLAQLGIARAYALMTDNAKARKAYEDFLALWKDADPDIPVLQQAKDELARLRPSAQN